jgi:ankyrin repeat protein
MRSFVEEGAEVRGLSTDGNTLLHAAGLALDRSCAWYATKLLVGAGCDPSARNRQGKTALHIAAEKGSTSVMKYILSLDRSLPNDILFSVLISRGPRVSMLKMLIGRGANTHVVAADGSNLLHFAIISYETFPDLTMAVVVRLLLENGCDAFTPNSRGETPLHLAVSKGYVLIVEWFITLTYSTLQPLPADILACALDREAAHTRHYRRALMPMLKLLIETGANTCSSV